jgi:hypothetical protein
LILKKKRNQMKLLRRLASWHAQLALDTHQLCHRMVPSTCGDSMCMDNSELVIKRPAGAQRELSIAMKGRNFPFSQRLHAANTPPTLSINSVNLTLGVKVTQDMPV